MTSLRTRLHQDEILVGTFCAIAEPACTELLGSAGFDFLVFDAEHSMIDRGDIAGLIRAAECVGAPIIFRVPGVDPEWISAVLDTGCKGVIIPRVGNADEARAAVQATRYPPVGARGLAAGRAAGYGARIQSYVATANQDLLLVLQVETAEGVANIEEIATVEGVDAIFIGPGDLAMSLEAMGPEGRPKVEAAIESIVAACRRVGRQVGLFHAFADGLGAAIDRGMRFHTVGADFVFLQQRAGEVAQRVRDLKLERASV